MTTLPVQMTDRWASRSEPGPGQGIVYWHMLMNDHPQVVSLATKAQQRLAPFTGLHMTPLERLHMTTMIAGPSHDFSDDQLHRMSGGKFFMRLVEQENPLLLLSIKTFL